VKKAVGTLILALAVGGCDHAPASPDGVETTQSSRAAVQAAGAQQDLAHLSAAARRDLAVLRASVAPYHRFENAATAGYGEQFPPGCMYSPEGGMGLHYIDRDRLTGLDPASPHLLIYEPQKNGTLRFVGVEYLAGGAPTDSPPVLFDTEFNWNQRFQLWVLHVWVGRNNPDGLFSNYNRAVSCTYAEVLDPGSHH
jgi:hypothetical protein